MALASIGRPRTFVPRTLVRVGRRRFCPRSSPTRRGWGHMTLCGPPKPWTLWLDSRGPLSRSAHVPERLHTLAAPADGEWGLCPTAVPEDRVVGWRIDGFWCVLGRVGTRLFAYREICPGCGSSLVQSPVTEGVVTCSICRRRYDLTRAGRSLEMDVRGMRSAPATRERPSPGEDPEPVGYSTGSERGHRRGRRRRG
jgi:nitrite reductase/ring-hydroxylating ferredoxin subunit